MAWVTAVYNATAGVLALDLGTKTGWAYGERDIPVESGVMSFAVRRFDGGGMRYLRFRRWLESRWGDTPLSAIYFEAVRRHLGCDAAHVYGGMLAVVTAWAEDRGVPYGGLGVGAIKKHATGHGNASKDEMIAAMRAKGHHPADDNEADALAILHYYVPCLQAPPARRRKSRRTAPPG